MLEDIYILMRFFLTLIEKRGRAVLYGGIHTKYVFLYHAFEFNFLFAAAVIIEAINAKTKSVASSYCTLNCRY